MSTNSQARDPAWKEKERNRIMILLDDCVNRIRELKISYNSLSPVSPLPFEILAKIFEYHHFWYDSQENWRGYFAWMNITVVCRQWREVALKLPSLWCSIRLIDGVRSGFVQQFLDRSQGLPLTLTFRVYHNFPQGALQTALLQSHRIEAMDICLRKIDYDALGCDPLFQPLPSLKRLTMAMPPRQVDNDYVTIPIPRGGFDIPVVRELVVDGYLLDEHSSLWTPHLTSLQFTEGLHHSAGITPLGVILRVLSLLPNLQSLTLHRFSSYDSRAGEHPLSLDTPVELRRLQNLDLCVTATTCVSILSNLVFPTSAALSVDLDEFARERQLHSLVDCLVSHLSGARRIGTTKPVLSCAFSVEPGIENAFVSIPDREVLSLWTSDVSYGCYHCGVSDSQPPAFKMIVEVTDLKSTKFIQDVFLRLPLKNVTSLSLTRAAPSVLSGNLPVFSELCAAMPNITSLNSRNRGEFLRGSSHSHIQRFFVLLGPLPPQNNTPTSSARRKGSRRQHARPAQSVSHYAFSQLKTLRLEGIDFQPEKTSPLGAHIYRRSSGDAKAMDAWINVLQNRRRDGSPITTLLLRKCYWVGDEEVGLCRTAVEDVKWDRKFLAIDGEGNVTDRSDEIR